MSEHIERTTALKSFELEEVEVPIGEAQSMVQAIKLTIHGQNIFLRALEPSVRMGDTEVLFPEISPDERTITGFVTSQPQEGAPITLQYPGQEPVTVPERRAKLRRPQP